MPGFSALGQYALGQESVANNAPVLPATGGSYALTGKTASGRWLRTVLQGVYTLTGRVAALLKGKSLIAAVGAYVLTGIAAGVKAARKVSVVTGVFVLTGRTVALFAGKGIGAFGGAYTLAGQAATTAGSRTLAMAKGTFTLTGFTSVRRLVRQSLGYAYTLLGRPALNQGFSLTVAGGSYTLSGVASFLTRVVSTRKIRLLKYVLRK